MRLGRPHRPGLRGPLAPWALWPLGALAPKHSGPFFLEGPALLETLGWSQPVYQHTFVETDTQSSLPPRAKPCPTALRRLELTRMA
jgi:hypothetical protein